MEFEKSEIFFEDVKERIGECVLSSTIRPATPEDIVEAEMLQRLGRCPHNIVQDTAGWPYDLRNCVTCGKGLGVV